MHGHQAILERQSFAEIPGHTAVLELGAHGRGDVGGDRDAAVATVDHHRQRRRVVAAELAKIGPHQQAHGAHPREVAGGVLDSDHHGQLPQCGHGFGGQVDRRAAGDVVDEQGQVGSVVDRLEVGIQPLLGGFVVIGRDHHDTVGAGLFGVLGERHRFGGRIRSGAGDHRHPACRRLDAQGPRPGCALREDRGGRFAGGPARHQAVGALAHLPFDECLKRRFVHGAVLERGDEGGDRSLEHGRPARRNGSAGTHNRRSPSRQAAVALPRHPCRLGAPRSRLAKRFADDGDNECTSGNGGRWASGLWCWRRPGPGAADPSNGFRAPQLTGAGSGALPVRFRRGTSGRLEPSGGSPRRRR